MIKKFWLSNKNSIFIFVSVAVMSLIPVIYTWGRLPIGGDVGIPLSSAGSNKYLYQWVSLRNGQYFSLSYFGLYLFYWVCDLFKLNIYLISSVMLFLLNFVSGLGIYSLVKLFISDNNNKKFYFYLLPIINYLISPALLNGWVFGYVYSFAPWFIYFVFKTIKFKQLKIKDLIFMSFLFSILSADLPNPKYIFHLGITTLFVVISAIFLKLVDFKYIANNLVKLILFFLLTAYLFLPLFYFASNYSAESYGTYVKAGYVNTGPMMDYGTATVDKMLRLHQDNMNLDTIPKAKYNQIKLIEIPSYFLIASVIIGLLFIKNKYYLQVSLLVVLFLLFSIGPNEPLGFIYEYFVSSFKFFAFLRTTAGAVFFLSIFYSIMLAFVLERFSGKSKLIYPVTLLCIIATSYPFLNGDYYKNRKSVNPYTDNKQYGQRIPQEYFDLVKDINFLKKDERIVYSMSELGYINTTWGFFGYPLYNFLYNSNNMGYQSIYTNLANHNVGLIYNDKSIVSDPWFDKTPYDDQSEPLIQKGFIELRKVKEEYFMPHFYVPGQTYTWKGETRELKDILNFSDYQLRSEILLWSDQEQNEESLQKKDYEGNKLVIKSNLLKEEELITYTTGKPILFPKINTYPDNIFYPLTLKIEDFDLKRKKSLVSKFNYYLSLSNKRIAEITSYEGEKNIFDTFLTGYNKTINSTISVLEEMKTNDDKDFLTNLVHFQESLKVGEKKLEKVNFGGGASEKMKKIYDNYYLKIRSLRPKHDYTKSVYQISVPVEGEYEVFAKDIILDASASSVLSDNNKWQLIDKKYFTKGTNEYFLESPDYGLNLISGNLNIDNYTPNTVYRVTLRYRSNENNSIFSIIRPGGDNLFSYSLPPTGIDYDDVEIFFRSPFNEDRAFVYLSVPEYENLNIQKVAYQEILLRLSLNNVDESRTTPKITFVKINPTKYLIKVEGAKEPYSLVFSENYHRRWKAYINKLTDSKINGLSRYGEIVASYFEGDIKEGTHKNIFLDRYIFETWGLKTIPDDQHRMVNGYANDWTIDTMQICAEKETCTKNMNGGYDMEVIVEFLPQRIFYIGLTISLTTLFGCLIYVVFYASPASCHPSHKRL